MKRNFFVMEGGENSINNVQHEDLYFQNRLRAKCSNEMADLLARASTGEITLIDLMRRGGDLSEMLSEKDPKGFDEGAYKLLHEVFRRLDDLHDSSTREFYEKNPQSLSALETNLRNDQ